MNVTKYVKSLRAEQTALSSRLTVVGRELDEISSALAEETAPAEPRLPRQAAKPKPPKPKRAAPIAKTMVRDRVIAALVANQPTTRLALDEIIKHDSRTVLKGMVRTGAIVCRSWKLADDHGKPPFYYALTVAVLDRMEQELIDSGQWARRGSFLGISK